MKAQYLLRLDDAHPEMNHDNWSIIEQMCIQYNVKPIVAIIPDNKDSNIVYQTYDDTFWGTARKWQEIGWSIAIHGLNHKLTKSGAGLVGINNYSEFVGVDQSIQDSMIYNAYMILSRKGLAPSVWVAPAHGLDMKTLNSLLAMTPVRVISDGLSMFPYDKYGMQWSDWRHNNEQTQDDIFFYTKSLNNLDP